MARAITSGELTKLRSSNQFSKLYLAIHKPAKVFQAQVNQATWTSYDAIAEVPYDNVLYGAYTDILPGQTLYVGTSADAYDRGFARMRSADGTKLYIGEESEIVWQDDLYLTVVDEFDLWPKHIRIDPNDPTNFFMDYDITYSNQHKLTDPVPVLGPDWVVWLTGSTVDVTPDASSSWTLNGTISGYSWTAPGASATSGMTTATPTITYDTAGQYRISCTITGSNGKTFTGYRYVFVYSSSVMPTTEFVMESCSGDAEIGGWSARLVLYDQALLSDIRDRVRVIIFSQDWYGGVIGSIGPLTGYENILMMGWVDGETILKNPEYSSISFEVQGPYFWLNKMTGFPTGVEDTDYADNDGGDPDRWTEFDDLTLDKGLWHFLHWRTTATAVLDVMLSGDTRQLSVLEASLMTNLWEQLVIMSQSTIFAFPRCDRYGRLFVEQDIQYQLPASRSGIPLVMTILTQDWHQELYIERQTVGAVALVELSGTYYSDGNVVASCARGFGTIPARYGNVEKIEKIALSSANNAAEFAGLVLGQRNNPYPLTIIAMASNNKFIDISPIQYVHMDLSASETERGIVWDNNFIARRITHRYNAQSGLLQTELEVEMESLGLHGMIVACPTMPEFDGFDFLPPTFDWPIIPEFDWEEVLQRNSVGDITRRVVPPYSKPVKEDMTSLTGTATQFHSTSLTGPNWFTYIVSDDEYLYFCNKDASPQTIVRYKIADGTTTSISLGSEGTPYLCLLSKNHVGLLVFDTVGDGVKIKEADFTGPSLTEKKYITAPTGSSYLQNPAFFYTYLYNGDLYSVFDWGLVDNTTGHFYKLTFQVYNWTTDQIKELVIHERDPSSPRYISYLKTLNAPVLMNNSFYYVWYPFWLDTRGSFTPDETYGIMGSFYINSLVSRSTTYDTGSLTTGEAANIDIISLVPYQKVNRLYFYFYYYEKTTPYHYICWVNGQDLLIAEKDMHWPNQGIMFHSKDRAYRYDKDTGKVYDLLSTKARRSITIPPAVQPLSVWPWKIAQAVCDEENMMWTIDQTTGVITGYDLTSKTKRTLSTSTTGNIMLTILPRHFILQEYVGTGGIDHRFYIIK